MSDHDDFDRVEQLLRSASAPTTVPSGLIDVAREAALSGGLLSVLLAGHVSRAFASSGSRPEWP